MNITIFSPGVVPPTHYGGTERVIDWLVKELAALGHRVSLFGPAGCRVPAAAQFFPVGLPAGDINRNPVDFRDQIPADTDIVHIHCATDLDYGLPTVKTVHGYPFHTSGAYYARREEFDESYSFISNAHRSVCGRPESPFVYNGIDLTEYEYREEKEDWFLFLAKVDWNAKGLSVALRIAREKGLKLKIAGDFLDPGFYERELKRELTSDIQYVGPVGGVDKRELLAGARGLIFPTRWPEPFGLVVTEALASGTPVLTSCNGAMPELMVQGVTGFMADSDQEMAAQVDHIDRIDPKACRAHVARNFTSRIMAENYLRLYARTIGQYAARQGEDPKVREIAGREHLVGRDPKNLQAWLELVTLHLEQRQIESAVGTLKRMLDTNPYFFQGYANLVQLLRAVGDGEQAERVTGLLRDLQGEIGATLEALRQ